MRLSVFSLSAFILLLLSSCLPETTTETPRQEEGFSSPDLLAFSAEEYAVLQEQLNIRQDIELRVTDLPFHLRQFSNQARLETSSSDARKALLGRVLFYDKQLSATGETSCNTCHLQEAAFSDTKAFSDGINGMLTKRNSIALGSVPTFAPAVSGYGSSADESRAAVEGTVRFFWDERARTVKEQSEATIEDEIEMGRSLHELSSDLRNQEMYRILSMKAYGTPDLTPDRITLALEKFTSSITSLNTRFDEMMDARIFGNDDNGRFSAAELNGRDLFDRNCASCHGSQMAQPQRNVANNGLELTYRDKGMGALSGNAAENGVFKVPFLRNVALTAPYMHDGRFNTLREVIDHYSEGIAAHPNLNHELRNFDGSPRRMNFTETEKNDLIAFLRMTTDEQMLTDAAFSDPFRR